jgi:predicted transcriptional regulator
MDLSREIKGGFGADLMSDVLASIQPEAVLFTGLCNPQVVRTAQMADVAAIVLVRGKRPPAETVRLANEEDLPLISTPYGMFEVCGRLHEAGLASLEVPILNGPYECGE